MLVFYMLLNVEDLLDKINKKLPPQIRVMGKQVLITQLFYNKFT